MTEFDKICKDQNLNEKEIYLIKNLLWDLSFFDKMKNWNVFRPSNNSK